MNLILASVSTYELCGLCEVTLPEAPCLEGVGDVTIAGLLREQNETT